MRLVLGGIGILSGLTGLVLVALGVLGMFHGVK